ncbi:MAG: response regulator [Desulfobacter sp.]|nr:MAG: response regulator [Desulfobacter sp.]
MPFNPFTLAFARQWADLEPGFLDFHFKESLGRIRLAILAAVFFYAVFGILDHVMVPDKKLVFWSIRYLAVIPFALVVLFLSFRPGFKERSAPLLFSMCLIGGLGIEYMIILADPPATYSYYAGLILVFITVHTFLSLRFLWASACSWSIVILYEIAALWLSDTPAIILINNNFFFISAVCLCMLAGYTMEMNARYRYLAAHMLTLEKEKVGRINEDLDRLVRERTKELSRAYHCIKVEMDEREESQARQLKLEKELNRKQKMEAIGTLAGGIAHDFNNILSAVIGYTELAMDEPEEEKRRDNHSQVVKAALRAKDLIGQILAFSRQGEHELVPLNLKPVVKEALKLLRASLPAGIEIKTRLETDSLVMADPTQIHRIIINICTNALHAMPDHTGILDIALEEVNMYALLDINRDGLAPGNYIQLTISDTGCGMTPEIMEKIFDPFFTTKKTGQGTGMGLSVVHGIIEQYRGSIRVSSEPGKGTTFIIRLPCTGNGAEELQALSPDAIPRGTESILVLDDEIALSRILEKTLTALGYSVTAFFTPEAALSHLKENPARPDLIITDFAMPKMNGIQFAQKVNAGTDIPVILCTGYSENIAREKMSSANIKGFLLKPLTQQTIAETVRQVLDG